MAFVWQTFASLRLFTCLVHLSTYCVPIAHLRQNKPVCITLFGAQIIIKGCTTGHHTIYYNKDLVTLNLKKKQQKANRRPKNDLE